MRSFSHYPGWFWSRIHLEYKTEALPSMPTWSLRCLRSTAPAALSPVPLKDGRVTTFIQTNVPILQILHCGNCFNWRACTALRMWHDNISFIFLIFSYRLSFRLSFLFHLLSFLLSFISFFSFLFFFLPLHAHYLLWLSPKILLYTNLPSFDIPLYFAYPFLSTYKISSMYWLLSHVQNK